LENQAVQLRANIELVEAERPVRAHIDVDDLIVSDDDQFEVNGLQDFD